MGNRMLQLAHLDRFFSRMGFVRWIARTVLFLLLLLSLLNYANQTQPVFIGIFFILLPAGIILDLFHLFLKQEIESQEETEKKSEKGGYSYAAARVLAASRGNSQKLWFYTVQEPSVRFVLTRLGFSQKRMYDGLPSLPKFDDWMGNAKQLARSQGSLLKPEHIFEVLQSAEPLAAIWRELGITVTERADVWRWYYRLETKIQHQRRGFVDSLKVSGGIGRDWSSGYTRYLERFAFNLTNQLQLSGRTIDIVGHQEERQKILEYLSRDHTHNTILVGEDGIGKERMIYALASDFIRGEVPLNLKYKHVYMLDTGQVISASNQNELEMRLHALFNEASSVGNIVLVIPDFHLLVGAQNNDTIGSINASAVLSTYLKSPQIQLVATITPAAYYSYVKPNATLEPYLLPIEVKEIGSQEALSILQDEVFRYEYKIHKTFSYQALSRVVQIADQHIHDHPYPEKALELLDEVSGSVTTEQQSLIVARDVDRIVGAKLKIPMGTVAGQERDVLNNLEQLIQSRIIGQHEAVLTVANAIRRARAGLHSGKRPIGSFLFLGPTGVGKTEMAKTVAALYYKNEKAFIRLDMSEYQTPESIEKMVGTPTSPGILTTAITDQPFSVVLLDEIEKAAPSVRNVFLQILDDGYVTDGYGKKVDFTNAMVIATSNAGAQFIRETVAANAIDASFKQRLLDILQSQGIYSPEWLNRFDAVVVFLPLTRDEILEVAKLQVADLIKRLKSHDINLTVADDVYDVLIQRGYDPQFGARPMRRAVQDSIETALAKALLNDSTEGEKSITLTAAMIQG